MRVLFMVLLAATMAVAGLNANWNGTGDTAVVTSFRSDSLRYTKAFLLSANENLRVDMMADDTSNTGFSGDSLLFVWGVQTGHMILNSSGNKDTMWNPLYVVCDTMDLLNGTFGPVYTLLGLDGAYSRTQTLIDTLSVSGFAVQSVNVAPYWDVLVRGWVKGLTGYKTFAWLIARFGFNNRQRVKTGQ